MTTVVLAELLGGIYRSKVLELLFQNPEESYYLRKIESKTNVSAGSLRKLLPKLKAAGIIRVVGHDNEKLYQANPDLPGASDLARLIAHYSLPTQELRDAAASLGADAAAAVFGSSAAGPASAGSDIDVLVIGTISRVDAQATFKSLARRLSRPVNVTVLTPEEFHRQAQVANSFVADVLSKPTLLLQGELNALANA